jgi:hypothetical protein
LSSEAVKRMRVAANAVSEKYDASVYVYSGGINSTGYGRLLEAMQPSEFLPVTDNAILLLTTSGGSANSAYQIARRFQEAYKNFTLVVAAHCKSAGTLIALGAHTLVMDDIAELGPLDVQLLERDEIGKRKSGLVVRTAFEGLAKETFDVYEQFMLGIKYRSGDSVSFETASRIASAMAAGVMAPIYSQISPETLGNDLRDLRVAVAYGERLPKEGKNSKTGSIGQLVEGYPSHDYIIDRSECCDLFNDVQEPCDEMSELIAALGGIVYAEQSPHVVLRCDALIEEMEDADEHAPTEEAPNLDG